jgi:hypothetical protein
MAQLQLTEAQTHAIGQTDTAIAAALRSIDEARRTAASQGAVSVEPASASHPALLQAVADAVAVCVARVGAFSPQTSNRRLLQFADRLVALGEYEAARDLCYEHCARVQPADASSASNAAAPDGSSKPPIITRGFLEIKVAADYGAAVCSYYLLVARDPQLRFPRSVEELRQLLRRVQAAQNTLLNAENDFQEQLCVLLFGGGVAKGVSVSLVALCVSSQLCVPAPVGWCILCDVAWCLHPCCCASLFRPHKNTTTTTTTTTTTGQRMLLLLPGCRYHLIFNGTVHLYTLARTLVAHGQSEHATEFLTWAVLVMESIISLSTVK